MSTKSTVAGTTRLLLIAPANASRRSSGTAATPRFASLVAKGQFFAAAPARVRLLNTVDLPTFGNPTIPTLMGRVYQTVARLPGGGRACGRIIAEKRSKDDVKGRLLDRQLQIQILLDHYEKPRHRGSLENADVAMPGGNPGCGDVVTVYLKVADDQEHIQDATYEGEGCTISMAASSMILNEVHRGSLT